MPNEQLVQYLRRQITDGFSKNDLVKATLAVGWKASDINAAFAAIESSAVVPPEIPAPAQAATETSVRPLRVVFITLGILLVVGAGVGLVYLYMQTSPTKISPPAVSENVPTAEVPVQPAATTSSTVHQGVVEPVATTTIATSTKTIGFKKDVVSSTPDISKSSDATIKSNLFTIQTQAEIYYATSGGNSYGAQAWTAGASTQCRLGMFSSSVVSSALAGATNVVCYAGDQSYLVGADLAAGGWWCVDSEGVSKAEPGTVPVSATVGKTCP